MLKILKEKIQNRNKLKGCVLIEEVIPYFSDAARTSNKSVYILKKNKKENKGIFKNTYSEKEKTFSENQLLTQNDELIKIKNFKFDGKLDKNFSKEGFEVGQIYKVENLGYLGNESSTIVVKWVLDKYVVFEDDSNITLSNYQELKRLNMTLLS